MMRDNERGVIGLEFEKKKYKLFFIRAESSHEPSRPQLKLGSFNYRAGLARAKLARARLARARIELRARTFLRSPTADIVCYGSRLSLCL
jgi:hypothetical protein